MHSNLSGNVRKNAHVFHKSKFLSKLKTAHQTDRIVMQDHGH